MTFFVFVQGEGPLHKMPDGRLLVHPKRMTAFSRKEAKKIQAMLEKNGEKTRLLPNTPEILAWLQGGRRAGSDWVLDS